MKQFAYQKYKFSGDLYKYVSEQTGSTEEIKYYFVDRVSLHASVDDNQRLTIKTDEAIQIGSLISNITDVNNNKILADAVWQITNIAPIFNAFNAIESYRLRAVKYQGDL